MMAKRGEASAFIEAAKQYTGDECLLWPFAQSTGYGRAGGGLVHVQVCTSVRGPKPSRLHEVRHSCGVRICCAPAHLSWGTRADNERDKINHGRSNRGERGGAARLNRQQVVEIRQSEQLQSQLALRFGVSQSAISAIQLRKTWAWL